MERAAETIDQANAFQGHEAVSSAAIAVAEAKVASTEVAISATNKLFELVGPESLRKNMAWTGTGGTREFTLSTIRSAGSTTPSAISI